jgi:predicted ArsR family transcriptional regulator
MTRAMRMQEARDRAWTCEEIAEAFGVCLKTVKSSTYAEGRGLSLTRAQRAVLRWALEECGGMLCVPQLASRVQVMEKNAVARLRRLESKGYVEPMPLEELNADARERLGNPDRVWSLTVLGLRAAKDRLVAEVVA